MCMAAGLEPVHHVHVNGWLLVGGEKLGKTMAAEGAVKLTDIEPIGLTEEFGVDRCATTCYARRPSATTESSRSRESPHATTPILPTTRATSLRASLPSSRRSAPGSGQLPRPDSDLKDPAMLAIERATTAWGQFAPQRALEVTFDLVGATNAYLEAHAPWKMEPGSDVDAVMGDALEAIRLVAVLISPAMPGVAHEIWQRIGLAGAPNVAPLADVASWGQYPGGTVEKGEPLFPRIKSDE